MGKYVKFEFCNFINLEFFVINYIDVLVLERKIMYWFL